MTKLGPYEVHPFADAFPLIEGDEFNELVLDIKKAGLREPITLTHDRSTIVDGRNRYRACEAASLDPVFDVLPRRYTESMILDLIVSRNLARRQLNRGQAAFLALTYEKMYADAGAVGYPEGRDRTLSDAETPADRREPRHDRESAARAANVVGASGRMVQRAKAVQRDAPDLADRVRSGEIALDAAERQRKERVRSQPRLEPAPKSSPVMLTLRTHKGDEVQYPQPKGKSTFNETTGEGISWASWSWNPVTGCLHNCDYCYAREIAASERAKSAYPVGFTPLFHHERLAAPANTSVPTAHRDDPSYKRVFVCSMADLYGRWVPDEWIEQVHGSMLASPWWQYILLTKFPSRYVGLDLPPKAWVGTSVDEQKRVRIAEDAFRKIDGVAVKWLSLEPLREPLEFDDLSMFDWVVIGSQTETRQPDGTVSSFAPPFEWVARIVLQAKEAGCRVHMKPNLLGRTTPQLPGMALLDEYPEVG
jgi:protein gp37